MCVRPEPCSGCTRVGCREDGEIARTWPYQSRWMDDLSLGLVTRL
jgi:hypothetical protein